jgi:hypothetical protein
VKGDDLCHAPTMRRRLAAFMRGMFRACVFLCIFRAEYGNRTAFPAMLVPDIALAMTARLVYPKLARQYELRRVGKKARLRRAHRFCLEMLVDTLRFAHPTEGKYRSERIQP